MKKLTSLFAFLLCSVLIPNNSNAQAAGEGDVVFDVTYGFPNLFTTVLEAAYVNSGSDENVEIGGVGPLGLHFEYFVSDGIAIGVILQYTNTSLSYTGTGLDSLGGNTNTYNYDIKVPRIRVMPRISFHYGSNDDFDFYSYVAMGYKSTTTKTETNDPNFEVVEYKNPVPVAFRIATGARYFFTDNIGLNMELGLFGGGIITGGVSVKL